MKKLKIFFLLVAVCFTIMVMPHSVNAASTQRLYIDNALTDLVVREDNLISGRSFFGYLGYTINNWTSGGLEFWCMLKSGKEVYTVKCHAYDKASSQLGKPSVRTYEFSVTQHLQTGKKAGHTFAPNAVAFGKDFYLSAEDMAYILNYDTELYPEINAVNLISSSIKASVKYTELYDATGSVKQVNEIFVNEYLNIGYKTNLSQVGMMTVYSADGRTREIYSGNYAAEKAVGWYAAPPVYVYAADGRQMMISSDELPLWLSVGWYEEPVGILYAEGKEQVFYKKDIPAQLTVGWYSEPVQRLYTLDGRSQLFFKKNVSAQLKVGWYTTPVVRLYSEFETKVFPADQLYAQLSVGWYKEPVKRLVTMDGRSSLVEYSKIQSWKNVGWIDVSEVARNYNLNTPEGIIAFLNTYFRKIATATGTYDIKHSISHYNDVYNIHIEYPYTMESNMVLLNGHSVNDCVSTKYQVKDMMYVFASTVMNNTTLPVEMSFYKGGYAYPTIRVGYSSTQLCCKNYTPTWITAWDGSQYLTYPATGFEWAFYLDDSSIYRDLK